MNASSFGSPMVHIRNTEVVKVINGTPNFSIDTFVINPANNRLFPYLSKLASLYEQYRFKGLIFEYVTTSGMVTSAAGQGNIGMVVNYDPDSNLPNSFIEM